MLNEENLPELLRKALQAKKEEDEREGILSGEGAICSLMLACSLSAITHLDQIEVCSTTTVRSYCCAQKNRDMLHCALLSDSKLCSIEHSQSRFAVTCWAVCDC